ENPALPASSRAPPSRYSLAPKSARLESSRRPSSDPPEARARFSPASLRRKESNRSSPYAKAPARAPRCRTPSLHAQPNEKRGKEKPVYSGRRQRVAGELCAASLGPLRCVSRLPPPESSASSSCPQRRLRREPAVAQPVAVASQS